jgi:hypothetical protein
VLRLISTESGQGKVKVLETAEYRKLDTRERMEVGFLYVTNKLGIRYFADLVLLDGRYDSIVGCPSAVARCS